MKNLFMLLILGCFCWGLSGCSSANKLLWWKKDSGAESTVFVDEKNPLAVPPEYKVRPIVAQTSEE